MTNKNFKFIRNSAFGFIIGGLLFGTMGISAATYLYNSSQVSYNNNGVTNINEALDELYSKSNNQGDYIISGTPTWKNISETYDYSANYVMFYPNKIYLFNQGVDLTDYKYLVLVYRKFTYYTSTIGMGVTTNPSSTLADCQNLSTQAKVSWTGNSLSNNTIELMYLDVSDLNGMYYPFAYLNCTMYTGYYYFYLTKDTAIPSI